MLLGAKCYTDASLTPDTGDQQSRKDGIGIFILHLARHHKFFIKAQTKRSTSVLMAEAAAMATAATIIRLLNMNQVSFLTDNQALVNFFNGGNLDNPPHWEIKSFTQRFLNEVSNKQIQVLKIARNLNTTAHSLAGQAFRHSVEGLGIFTVSCTNGNHANRCPLSEALQSISLNFYTLVAAFFC